MTKRLQISFMCAICSILIWGQNTDYYYPHDYSIIPPSPEVASLMRYIDFPMSTFTGQPNVNLPIYTINEGALEVPISISYHGGGIKVDEQSGHVGLGWTLNAGGCVSRTVHNIPDESPNCHSLHYGGSSLYNFRGLLNLNSSERELRDSILNRTGGDYSVDQNLEKALPYSLCSSYDDGLCDMANDIFQFNCLGYSGGFILTDNNNPNSLISMSLSTDSPVEFTNNYDRFLTQMFELKDNMQTTFQFGQLEETRFDHNYKLGPYDYTDSIYYISSWHLTKVFNLMGDTINFSYTCSGFRHEYNGTSEVFSKSSNTDVAQDCYTIGACAVTYYPQLLSAITTKSTIVEFEYSENDIIQSIKVYRRKNNKELVKSFVFNHQLIERNRMLLTSVDEVPRQSNSLEAPIRIFEFEYDTTSIQNDFAQDKWGYYNGGSNSSLLIDYPMSNSNDRNPCLEYAKAGILTKVKYPTGGYTQFDWELNDFSYVKGIIFEGDTTETVSNSQEYRLYGKIVALDEITRSAVKTNIFDMQKQISVSDDKRISVEIDVKTFIDVLMTGGSGLYINNSPYDYHHNELDANGTAPRIELKAPNGSIIGRWFIDRYQANVQYKPVVFLNNYGTGTYTFILRYPYNWFEDASGYDPYLITQSDIFNNLVHSPNSLNANGDMGYVKFTITERQTQNKINSNSWGGLRLSKINSFSGDINDKVIEKRYTYEDHLQNGKIYSSGSINELPDFKSIHYLAVNFAGHNGGGVHGIQITQFTDEHSNGLYSTPIGGSHVEYPHVIESIGPRGYLDIEYNYSSQRTPAFFDRVYDSSNMINFVPSGAKILTSYAHHRGDLLNKRYYSNGKKYLEESYFTSVIDGSLNTIFTSDFHKILEVEVPLGNGQYSSDYATCRYKLIPYNKRLASINSTEFFRWEDVSSGTEIVQSMDDEVNYTYFYNTYNSNPHANLVCSESHLGSDGKTYITYFTYLHRNGKILALKETEVTVCENKIISSKRNEYDTNYRLTATFRGPTGMTNSSQFMIGNNETGASDALINAINIPEYTYQYDSYGNIVEISYKGFVLASYLWGYKGSHPIAEIKGVSFASVNSILPEGLKPNQLKDRYDLTPNDLSTIRSFFPGNDVTTITYDWLIGVGTMTDPRGVTTYFNYDDFGRLKDVKDFNGYFIRKYDYHYQNQN